MSGFYQEVPHVCRVTEQGWTETKKLPKRPMIILKVRPTHEIRKDPAGGDELHQITSGEYDEYVRVLVDASSEVVMDLALKKLRYAGFMGDSFADLNLVGADVRCNNTHRPYNGVVRDGFELMLPPHDGEFQPMDAKVARTLDTLFGRRLKEKITNGPAEQATDTNRKRQAVPANDGLPDTPPTDDEIPF